MVSMTELSKHHGSPESAARMRKRHAAEKRLKAYGVIAIFVAGAALISLLWSVVGKATGAMTESYLTMPIVLDQAEIDPDNTGDPTIIGRADFSGLTKDMLKATFPYVKGRTNRRSLYDIISGGGAFELREAVIADPSLVGQTLDYRFLASDISDLYLKGSYGEIKPHENTGTLTLESDGKEAVISSSAEDFAEVMVQVRRDLTGKAEFNRAQAALQENGRVVFLERAEAATSDDDRAAQLAEAAKREAERDRLLLLADEIDARVESQVGAEEIDEDSPSIFVRAEGIWIKLTEVSNSAGVGEVIGEFEGASELSAADWSLLVYDLPESRRKVSDIQAVLLEQLKEAGAVETVFNKRFFTAGDSQEPELAGIWGAAVGSFWTMIVTITLAFPVGVAAAIYLEEFAKRNVVNDFIEVNINNLAAVPSIVFGLLGLTIFIGFFGLPRSTPLVGGIVLAVMTLPTIIIAARAAIGAVPPSIRDAALGIGASKLQTSFHHVLPLSMPGILTGTIIGMARALGETAPLIIVGMVAFIADVPSGPRSDATVIPAQLYLWADFPERAFEARTSAAIVILLLFLILMNGLAVFLRKKFERRW